MRHALAILKYVPAVLCGLLTVAWVVSMRWWFGLLIDTGNGTIDATCFLGTVIAVHDLENGYPAQLYVILYGDVPESWLGSLSYDNRYPGCSSVHVPIPFLLTHLLPLAIGPFNRFRFPLWSYFVWTALVAAELAYYLRATRRRFPGECWLFSGSRRQWARNLALRGQVAFRQNRRGRATLRSGCGSSSNRHLK